jgi:hypothetical protein
MRLSRSVILAGVGAFLLTFTGGCGESKPEVKISQDKYNAIWKDQVAQFKRMGSRSGRFEAPDALLKRHGVSPEDWKAANLAYGTPEFAQKAMLDATKAGGQMFKRMGQGGGAGGGGGRPPGR